MFTHSMYLFINLGKLIIISDKFLRLDKCIIHYFQKGMLRQGTWTCMCTSTETFSLGYLLLFKVVQDNEEDTHSLGNQMM